MPRASPNQNQYSDEQITESQWHTKVSRIINRRLLRDSDEQTVPQASIGGCQSLKDTKEQKVKDATKPFKPTKSKGLTKLLHSVDSNTIKIKIKPLDKDFPNDDHVSFSWFSNGYDKIIDIPADFFSAEDLYGLLNITNINDIECIEIENPFVVQYEKRSNESCGGRKHHYMRLGQNVANPTNTN